MCWHSFGPYGQSSTLGTESFNNWGYGMMGSSGVYGWAYLVLGWITWLLLLAVLIAALRWFWRKGSK